MISTKEKVVSGLAEHDDAQLQTVAEFLEFLKFRERRRSRTRERDSMTVLRGEIWLAELNPIRGSEQTGTRPVLVMKT